MFDLGTFGKNLKTAESLKKEFKDEKELFIYLITILEGCIERDDIMTAGFGIDLFEYSNPLHEVIEQLFTLHYGEAKTQIILYYVYNRFDEEGNLVPLMIGDEEDEDDDLENEELYLNTPEELYDYINKIK